MALTRRQKRILNWVGYPLLALVTFVLVLHLTFPYGRVVDKYLVEPLSGKYHITYLSVDRGLMPGSVTVRGLALSSVDTGESEEDTGTNLYFKELSFDLGLLALVGGQADVDFVAKLGSGSIEGSVRASKAELETYVKTSGLPLAAIGGLRSAVGLPMDGALNATIDLTMPNYRWDKMNGSIKLACPGCTIGDGKAKIKPRAAPGRRMSRGTAMFAGSGLTVPQLDLGAMSGTMVIKDGQGRIEDFSAQSDDGEMALQAVVRFAREIGKSRFDSGCMKFRLSESLKKRETNFGNLPQFMKISPEPDGFSNVKLMGLVKAMRWLPTKKCTAGGDDEDPDERVARPRVTKPRITPTTGERPMPPTGKAGFVAGDKASDGDGQDSPEDENGGVTLPEPRTSGPPLTRPPHLPDDVNPGLKRVPPAGDVLEANDGTDSDNGGDGADDNAGDDGDRAEDGERRDDDDADDSGHARDGDEDEGGMEDEEPRHDLVLE